MIQAARIIRTTILDWWYNSLEGCITSPPKPHAFVSLPLQSSFIKSALRRITIAGFISGFISLVLVLIFKFYYFGGFGGQNHLDLIQGLKLGTLFLVVKQIVKASITEYIEGLECNWTLEQITFWLDINNIQDIIDLLKYLGSGKEKLGLHGTGKPVDTNLDKSKFITYARPVDVKPITSHHMDRDPNYPRPRIQNPNYTAAPNPNYPTTPNPDYPSFPTPDYPRFPTPDYSNLGGGADQGAGAGAGSGSGTGAEDFTSNQLEKSFNTQRSTTDSLGRKYHDQLKMLWNITSSSNCEMGTEPLDKLNAYDYEFCSSKIKLQRIYNDLPPHIQAKYPLTEQEKNTTPVGELPGTKNFMEYHKAEARFQNAIKDLYRRFNLNSYDEFRNCKHMSTHVKDTLEARLKELKEKSSTLEALAKEDFVKMIGNTRPGVLAAVAATVDNPWDIPPSSSTSTSIFKK